MIHCLVSERKRGVSPLDPMSVERYRYDKAGNMVKKALLRRGRADPAKPPTRADYAITTFAFDDANQLVSSTTDGVTTRYVYDAAGRLVKEGSKTYTYGYLDKVMSVTEGDRTYTYTYHADGQLASANYGGKTEGFLWDGLALVRRGDEHFVNEPHVGGGNPVASSKGTSYFNDMLGTTVGAKQGGKYSAAALSAFGEDISDSSSRSPFPVPSSPFFTGKPFVEGLGHAFLMRNYRAGLAKWQTADPIGYPDGWNQLAYCGNDVCANVDYLGAYVKCTFSITQHIFTLNDSESKTVSASSGDSNVMHQWVYAGPLPIGKWFIIHHPDDYRFQLWYAGDDELDDIARKGSKERRNIRLVIAPAEASHGCICLNPVDDLSVTIMDMIQSSPFVRKQSHGQNYRCYGEVIVRE